MPDLSTIGRWLLLLGLIVAAAGGVLWLAARLGFPLGRLPGDLRFEGKGFTCFLPLASSMFILVGVVSLLLGLLAEIMIRIYYESQDRRTYAIRSHLNGPNQ